ncbi:HlyD family secretion protein [Acetobacteraceae bacterium KSS8]|uniref:HlyD family secretion protein n=1 Tax=Endosaccharibacter trunci TaxID=2812733 RepID=A0ABT1W7P1_9PROT|nr:HlyD family secretion protein [Acetobacteraceae bacterium KSS8]
MADEDDRTKTKQDQNAQRPPKPAPVPNLPLWPWIVGGLIILVFLGVVLFILLAPRPDPWTNDAYVSVHYSTLAPRVSGQVDAVLTDDNQAVQTGQVLVTLDPRDYQTAVDMAEAAIARDTAQVGNASANVARQPAIIDEQKADIAQVEAQLGFALADQKRYGNLAATGAGTNQQRQQADSTVAELRAKLDAARAALDASRRQLDVLKQQVAAGEGTVKADRAQLEQAKLNLSYTSIRAPLNGLVGQRSVQVGDYVSPGTPLMAVVPMDRVFVIANYRELALRHVRIGQPATIHVDAYNIDLDGVVDSLPPASGATFSPIPPQNATGNFTKIVQRLPVKIRVLPNQPLAGLLKVGFSVETTIHTGLADVVAAQEQAPNQQVAR